MSGAGRLLVVGGGPAGATLAALVAATGVPVLLLERRRFPRDKVCGEFVSAGGCAVLARLGVLDSLWARGARPIDTCRVTAGGRRLERSLPRPPHGPAAAGISRHALDAVLLELAAARGAEVRERWEVLAPLVEGGRIVGVRAREVGGRVDGEPLPASLVVAADGRRSFLVRALHPELSDPTRTTPRSWLGVRTHVDADPDRLGRRVELHGLASGYVGLAPVEGGRINLCALVRVGRLRACGGSPERLWREHVAPHPTLLDALGGASPVGGFQCVGPLRFGARRATAGGALFVGDAAGTVDPFCGEGIGHALGAAELAAPIALRALAAGGLSSLLAREWEATWRRTFGPVTRRARLLGLGLERPALAGLALLGLTLGGRALADRIVRATRTMPTARASARSRSPRDNLRLPP